MTTSRALRRTALLLALLPGVAAAQGTAPVPPPDRSAPARSTNFWVGLGGGGYLGEEYDKPPGCCANPGDDQSYEVGGYALHGSFNVTGEAVGLRLRHSFLTDFTNNVAEETTLTVGLPMTPARDLWFAAGVSRLSDVSFSEKTPTVGIPVEILFYPVRGLELMLHGNLNDDSNFIGVALSGAIGRGR